MPFHTSTRLGMATEDVYSLPTIYKKMRINMLLRSMRKGFLSALFLGLLVLGAFSLILSDSTGTLRGSMGTGNIAEVDGSAIKMQEFNSRVSRVLRDQNIPPAMAYEMGLINNILNNEVFDLLVQKDAMATGIRIKDSIIAAQVKEIITPMKSGGLSDKEALKKFLELQGMSEKQLVSTLRADLTSRILKTTVSTASYVPKSLAKDLEIYSSATKNIDVLFIPNSSIKIKDLPDDKALKDYYQTKSGAFMKPETRDLTIAVIDTSKIKKPSVSDSDIKMAYDENKDKFQTPEQVNVEQSLLSDEDKAKEIVNSVKTGKSMSDAVNSIMGDKKSYLGKNGFSKEGLPTEISTPVFEAASGDVIGPIKSALGYHVIKLIEKTPAQATPFDKVKNKIREDLEAEKSADTIFEMTNDIEERLVNGEGYNAISRDYPVTLTSLKSLVKDSKADKNSAFEEKDFDKIIAKGFALKDNQPSELVDLSESKVFSVTADKINPSAPKDFQEVKSRILEIWINENKTKQNVIDAQKKIDDLIANKIAFSSLKPTSFPSMSRKGDEKIAKDVMARIQNAEKGKYILVISNEKNGIYISHINSISLPKDIKLDKETQDRLATDVSNANYMAYMESLQDKYPVKINDALIKRLYGKSETDTQ
jgi:peptidyl-prolyl cis-trans isomerase D